MVTYVYMNRIRKNNLEKNENRDKKKNETRNKKQMQSVDVARSQSVGGEGGAPC